MPYKCENCGDVEADRNDFDPYSSCDHGDKTALHRKGERSEPDRVDVQNPNGPRGPVGYNLKNPDPGKVFFRDSNGKLQSRTRTR